MYVQAYFAIQDLDHRFYSYRFETQEIRIAEAVWFFIQAEHGLYLPGPRHTGG
jgi:hypothetical protein